MSEINIEFDLSKATFGDLVELFAAINDGRVDKFFTVLDKFCVSGNFMDLPIDRMDEVTDAFGKAFRILDQKTEMGAFYDAIQSMDLDGLDEESDEQEKS
jgi:hypothetical protein